MGSYSVIFFIERGRENLGMYLRLATRCWRRSYFNITVYRRITINGNEFHQPIPILLFFMETKKKCLRCNRVEEMSSHQGNIVTVYAPNSGFFDMKQAVTSKLEDATEENIECENCGNFGATFTTEYITTQKVMIIQLSFLEFVDNMGIKSKSECIPLQNLDININGQTKKYELQYIIEHIGSTYNSGHYMSYFKKNNTWYCANDRSITRIETQNLPTQPYINIYKEVESVSLSTVEPLNVEDIELQENINNTMYYF